METIIHDITKKITEETIKNLENVLTGTDKIPEYIENTKRTLNDVGVKLIKVLFDTCEESIRQTGKQKREWYVEKRNMEKTYSTIFGDVKYKRTYYKNKKTGEYKYLSDDFLGIEVHERMDMMLQSQLIERAIDVSYSKSGRNSVPDQEFSNQTVMNNIRKLDEIENSAVEKTVYKKKADKKSEAKLLYVEADEDHVAMQDGTNKQMKLIYVHEGLKNEGKNRNALINPRYFTGLYNNNNEQLWLEVADYIYKYYDTDKIERVYLSGDGANWIKEGLNWIDKSIYVLDRFHLSKYIKQATAHIPYTTPVMWGYVNKGKKEWVSDLFEEILDCTENVTKRNSVLESRRYIMNNWEGIRNQYNLDYVGCSAEGHVSHILSDRLSSRPMGWSEVGADQMARLRVYKKNGGKVYDLIKLKKQSEFKERKIKELDKRVVKKKLNVSINETLDNLEIINIGKRTQMSEFLKSIRGA
ncbi:MULTISPECIES: ISLre2 family transposase [unclassified Sedimentibacter]|uniref:ISLre2 family transposase n=1 Tax=unclassified Sedimentibacter TaxID=2649220 RepID=UPI0027E0C0CF|nr:ISLre2 family transposase [Sedimentibacter sp. MB35-C1]WMJ77213.1 ISLre2 family transposase [Sedimentibacter sp. MB35-C1]